MHSQLRVDGSLTGSHDAVRTPIYLCARRLGTQMKPLATHTTSNHQPVPSKLAHDGSQLLVSFRVHGIKLPNNTDNMHGGNTLFEGRCICAQEAGRILLGPKRQSLSAPSKTFGGGLFQASLAKMALSPFLMGSMWITWTPSCIALATCTPSHFYRIL